MRTLRQQLYGIAAHQGRHDATRRIFGTCAPVSAVVGLLAALLIGTAVWGGKTPPPATPVLIGMLTYLWGATEDMVSLRDTMVELGYRENETFAVGARYGEGNAEMLTGIVRGFVRDGVDVIYASGWSALQAARGTAPTTPIVFSAWYDPRPGADGFSGAGNLTGVIAPPDVAGPDSLKILHALIPGLRRVLMPYDAEGLLPGKRLAALREAAHALGIALVERPLDTRREAGRLFATLNKDQIDAILPASNRRNLAGYALEAGYRRGIPALFSRRWMAEYGGLAAYGPSWAGLGRRAAHLVHRIVKGAAAGSIPVQVMRKKELIINLRTAKALGLAIPPQVLTRADRIIR